MRHFGVWYKFIDDEGRSPICYMMVFNISYNNDDFIGIQIYGDKRILLRKCIHPNDWTPVKSTVVESNPELDLVQKKTIIRLILNMHNESID